jgi:amidohydrolase
MNISDEVRVLEPELIELRRDFHRNPELGLEEHRTAARVIEWLTECGLTCQRMGGTGVVATLEGGKPGKTLMLRADMDALPVREENSAEYCSQVPGKMHACGHDGHTAMLMTAAKILCGRREEIAGKIKFCFEPNEENVGALSMIEEGLLENPKVDACMGLHLWAPIPVGQMAISPGPVMAGMDHFEVVLTGKGGHTATPQYSVDPIVAAANLIQTIQNISTREINPLTPTIIMFGRIEGGTAANIIPDSVKLEGTMRYLYDGSAGTEEDPQARFRRIVDGVCAAHRTTAEVKFLFGHPTLINDPIMAELARTVAAEILDDPGKISAFVSMAGEDFSEFASRVPSVFCFVGAGNPEKGIVYPHHHPKFDIDEDALPAGVELLVRGALAYLNS